MNNNVYQSLARITDEDDAIDLMKNNIINPLINNYRSSEEQQVLDINTRTIIFNEGVAGYFLKRDMLDTDVISGSDIGSSFNKAWQFAMLIASYDTYSGLNSFFSYAGLDVEDKLTIIISPSLFSEQCDDNILEMGDWIYFKEDMSLFEVKEIVHNDHFLPLGVRTKFKYVLHKVIYNQEELNPEIQNDHFNLFDFDDETFMPLKNLDGHNGLHFDPTKNNDDIVEYSDNITIYDDVETGSGIQLDLDEDEFIIEDDVILNDKLNYKLNDYK